MGMCMSLLNSRMPMRQEGLTEWDGGLVLCHLSGLPPDREVQHAHMVEDLHVTRAIFRSIPHVSSKTSSEGFLLTLLSLSMRRAEDNN